MARTLTDNQQRFLQVLFEEANGDVVTAKRLAGYSETTSTTQLLRHLKKKYYGCY
jgi:phage terminase small subunit